MTEPDFEQIAKNLTGGLIADLHGHIVSEELYQATLKQATHWLRQVWNARGSADVAQLDKAKAAAPPFPQADPYVKLVERAIRKLDR